MHAYSFKVAFAQDTAMEMEMTEVGKADRLSMVERNGQVGDGAPTSLVRTSRSHMKDTTVAKQQWGPEGIMTAVHVVPRKHGSWGRLSAEARDENYPALLRRRAF